MHKPHQRRDPMKWLQKRSVLCRSRIVCLQPTVVSPAAVANVFPTAAHLRRVPADEDDPGPNAFLCLYEGVPPLMRRALRSLSVHGVPLNLLIVFEVVGVLRLDDGLRRPRTSSAPILATRLQRARTISVTRASVVAFGNSLSQESRGK